VISSSFIRFAYVYLARAAHSIAEARNKNEQPGAVPVHLLFSGRQALTQDSMKTADMTSSPRTSLTVALHGRTPESRKAGSFLLFCAFLLGGLGSGSCSSMEKPASGTGGSSGLGGSAGAAGAGTGSAGSSGAEGSCFAFDSCIPSCSSAIITLGTGTCDPNGAVVCDNGYVPKSTCAPNACAQVYLTCCDDTTGDSAKPACGTDGLLVPCPAGSSLIHAVCIPSGLGVSTCVGLQGAACTMADQRCSEGSYFCICGPTPGADAAGMTWNCNLALP
jgi:hypothetical protein